MLACSFYPTGLGFFEEDLDLDLTVAGLVTSLFFAIFIWMLVLLLVISENQHAIFIRHTVFTVIATINFSHFSGVTAAWAEGKVKNKFM